MSSTAVERASAKTVLIVDDNADANASMAELIETLGHRAFCRRDGESGLAAALEHVPNLLILDLALPGMGGCDLARALRLVPAFRAAAMVAVSGFSGDERREAAIEAGFDDFFCKPLDFNALRRWLDGSARSARQELGATGA